MSEVLTIGEPMGLFIAEEVKPLKDVQQFTRSVCGAEVNFSIGLARLGHEVSYVSRVGADPLGAHIVDFLKENHIDTSYVVEDDEHLTGMQMKAKTQDGSDPVVVNYRKHTAFSYFVQQNLQNINWQGVRHVHATGIPAALSESCCDALGKMMEEARAHGCTVSFDPNLRPALWPSEKVMVETLNRLATKADLILPGINEGKILTGFSEPEQVADFYLQRGAQAVVVKLGGSKGAYAKEKSGKHFLAPSFNVEHVVDTVGAGDGFAVGIISALLEGLPLTEAVRRGTAIGALAVMSAGDNEGLPNRQKLQHFMEVA